MIFNFIIQAILFVGSVLYQQNQQKNLRRKLAQAQDRAKGFEAPVENEAIAVPIVYGRQLIGGAKVFHSVGSNYVYAAPATGGIVLDNRLPSSQSGTKREFMFVQQALCEGADSALANDNGINSVLYALVDGVAYNDAQYSTGQQLVVYPSGNVADPLMTANVSSRGTATFDRCAYATMVFKLNRDDPQYGGSPSVQFMVEGKKVRTLQQSGTIYSFVQSGGQDVFTYTTNPAYILLDYLMAPYGRDLSVSEIDLKSFYDAAQLCEETVRTAAPVEGNFWGSKSQTTRDLPRFECNITLDPSNEVRDNILSILDTMSGGDLIWSDGLYKLVLVVDDDPNNVIDMRITDNDIVREHFDVNYPPADDRFNQVTIRFANEHKDFKRDSVTWPTSGSTEYTEYLTQDNQVPLKTSYFDDGIVSPYHASAKAEFLVRESRNSVTAEFTIGPIGLVLEPGDIIQVTCTAAKVDKQLMKVLSVRAKENLNVVVNAVFYDIEINQSTSLIAVVPPVAPTPITVPEQTLLPPYNIYLLDNYGTGSNPDSCKTLYWDPPIGFEDGPFIVEYRPITNTALTEAQFQEEDAAITWTVAGTNILTTEFEIPKVADGNYRFSVRTYSGNVYSDRGIHGAVDQADGRYTLDETAIGNQEEWYLFDCIEEGNDLRMYIVFGSSRDADMNEQADHPRYSQRKKTSVTGGANEAENLANSVKRHMKYRADFRYDISVTPVLPIRPAYSRSGAGTVADPYVYTVIGAIDNGAVVVNGDILVPLDSAENPIYIKSVTNKVVSYVAATQGRFYDNHEINFHQFMVDDPMAMMLLS